MKNLMIFAVVLVWSFEAGATCRNFGEDLVLCDGGLQCKYQLEKGGTQYLRQIDLDWEAKLKRKDPDYQCFHTEEIPGGMKLECVYNLADRKEMGRYYDDQIKLKGKPDPKGQYTIGGKTTNDPVGQAIEIGICKLTGSGDFSVPFVDYHFQEDFEKAKTANKEMDKKPLFVEEKPSDADVAAVSTFALDRWKFSTYEVTSPEISTVFKSAFYQVHERLGGVRIPMTHLVSVDGEKVTLYGLIWAGRREKEFPLDFLPGAISSDFTLQTVDDGKTLALALLKIFDVRESAWYIGSKPPEKLPVSQNGSNWNLDGRFRVQTDAAGTIVEISLLK